MEIQMRNRDKIVFKWSSDISCHAPIWCFSPFQTINTRIHQLLRLRGTLETSVESSNGIHI